MKKLSLLFLTIMLTVFTSCGGSDDDGNQNTAGSFLETENFNTQLVGGVALDYEQSFGDGESFNIDLVLFNYSDAELNDLGSIPDDFVSFYIEAFSPVEGRLSPGIYNFNFTGNEFTFSDVEIEYENGFIEIESGTLEVLDSDSDFYELIFEGVDLQGDDIYLEYNGSVTYELQSSSGIELLSKPVNKFIFKNK